MGWGIHVNPWLIHVNAWQKPLQYYKVISLQLIKINEKRKKEYSVLLFSNKGKHAYSQTRKPLAATAVLGRTTRDKNQLYKEWTHEGKVLALHLEFKGGSVCRG